MTKQLLRISLGVGLIMAATNLNAQISFTFTSGDEGITGSSATVAHNPTAPGTLDVTVDTGSNDGIEIPGTIDASTFVGLRIVLKNNTTRQSIRIRSRNDVDTGYDVISVDNTVTPNDSGFKTYVYDLSADPDWDDNPENTILIEFRKGATANPEAGVVQIDSIEFLTTLSIEGVGIIDGLRVFAKEGLITTNKGNIESVYSMTGQKVGSSNLSSGIYIVTVKVGDLKETVKVAL
ncbi:hypothetical protein [Seonamhaeicola maritimus]|uniref:hypothetical protein n=1 Tax=Seonamhaeicola maritimus TaxID=2591822 RepID=UPI0024953F10|nr:hypothetical protein [Seonamhaeicola maritimus]